MKQQPQNAGPADIGGTIVEATPAEPGTSGTATTRPRGASHVVVVPTTVDTVPAG